MRIDNVLFDIKAKLWKSHTTAEADKILYPLQWYIYTGRASGEFERMLSGATERQKSTIARRLERHYLGSYEDAVNSVCKYLGYERNAV